MLGLEDMVGNYEGADMLSRIREYAQNMELKVGITTDKGVELWEYWGEREAGRVLGRS